jgi:hypothetical protein
LIPIYFGREDTPFDLSKCGCMVVQVKNWAESTKPKDIFREEFTVVGVGEESKAARSKKRKASGSESTEAKKEKPLREGPYFIFRDMKNSILFLLFDLQPDRTNNTITPSVEVSSSKDGIIPRVWAIQHDENVFGCLRQIHELYAKVFLQIHSVRQ